MKSKIQHSVTVSKISTAWLVFLLIWPFGAMIRALGRFRQPQSKTIFWLFCIFFGYVFIIPDNVPGAPDSSRIAAQLDGFRNQSLSISTLWSALYNPNEGLVDIYQPIVIYLVSIITGNPRILMAVFGAVFGFFYAQNLWLVFSRIKSRVGWLLFLFMLAFALVNPIWQINGVRMWTAAQIFLYGVLRLYLENDKKGLLWAASSILVHFSFMFPFALMIAFQFLPLNLTALFVFFWITAFLNELNLELVRDYLSFLPDVFQPKVETYTREAYAESRQGEAELFSWHVRYSILAGRIVKYLWIIAVFSFKKKWSNLNPEIYKLFALALLLGGFAQIASLVPSGGRFITVSNGVFWASFVILLSSGAFAKKLKPIKIITFLLLGFFIVFNLRVGMDFYGLSVFIGNPFTAPLLNDQTPIIEFVKNVF